MRVLLSIGIIMKIKLKILLFLGSMVCMFSLPCFAANYNNCQNYFQKVDFDLMFDGEVNVKNVVRNFCSIISDVDCESDSYFFDASQSVFLSILCNNVWVTQWFLSESEMIWDTALLKKYKFKQFDVYNYKNEETNVKWKYDYCDYAATWDDKTMNNCDFSVFAPQIFDILINDYFNIKQASNMWISELEDNFDKKKYANIYANNHFPWMEVLAKKWICESSYTQTCKYLKNYMSQVKNLLKTTDVIDVKNLWNKWKNVDCDSNFDENILYCGLLWWSDTPMISLVKAVYNEYYWYNLFMSYYEYYLLYMYNSENKTMESYLEESWKNVKTNTKKFDNVNSLNLIKVQKAQDNVYRSKEAISMALSSLSKIEYALPIHVWFLMYQEDITLFIDNLPKIYTPLRTLYDKLQNVQDANS